MHTRAARAVYNLGLIRVQKNHNSRLGRLQSLPSRSMENIHQLYQHGCQCLCRESLQSTPGPSDQRWHLRQLRLAEQGPLQPTNPEHTNQPDTLEQLHGHPSRLSLGRYDKLTGMVEHHWCDTATDGHSSRSV